jgi:16S rRNA pseudouridine516 synthase
VERLMRLDRFGCKSAELSLQQGVCCIHQAKVCFNEPVVLDEATQVHENNHIKLDGNKLTCRPFRY